MNIKLKAQSIDENQHKRNWHNGFTLETCADRNGGCSLTVTVFVSHCHCLAAGLGFVFTQLTSLSALC